MRREMTIGAGLVRRLLPGLLLVAFGLTEASAGPLQPGPAGQLADRSDLTQEIGRRQQDIENIDAKIDGIKQKIDEKRIALAQAAADYDAGRRKVRRLIIAQDQAAGADVWNLLLSSSDVGRTLADLRLWGSLLSRAAKELREVHGRGAALESELGELTQETSNLEEIKSLLEKRLKELKNELTLPAAAT